ncbi:LysR family transcriptional regulator [Paraburkholderia fungorum]|uniref:LysR family transcriptional regulator n=1 Tax=Paraburkholderia fungorum TaxID=134537 RepID=UPI0038B6DCBF
MATETFQIGNVSLKQLRAFVVVAQEKSFTNAAALLHVTQAAVSLLLHELEKELGVRLLDRTSRAAQLTEAGAEFLPTALRLLHELSSAIADTKELSNKRRGRVSIAASPLLCSLMLPSIIAGYKRDYPEISVVLRDVPSGDVRRLVEDGAVELGLSNPGGAGDLVTGETILLDEVLLIVPTDHPLAQHAQVSWKDLARYPLIALTARNVTRQLIDRSALEAGVRLMPQYEVSQVCTVIGMVSAGLGIAFVPGYASVVLDSHHVVTRRLSCPPITRPIALLHRRGRSLSPAAQTFRDFMFTQVGSNDDSGSPCSIWTACALLK